MQYFGASRRYKPRLHPLKPLQYMQYCANHVTPLCTKYCPKCTRNSLKVPDLNFIQGMFPQQQQQHQEPCVKVMTMTSQQWKVRLKRLNMVSLLPFSHGSNATIRLLVPHILQKLRLWKISSLALVEMVVMEMAITHPIHVQS